MGGSSCPSSTTTPSLDKKPVSSPETPLGGCSPVKERPGPEAPTGWSLLGCASSRSLRYPGPSSIQPAGRNPSRRRWGSRRNLPGGGVLMRVCPPNKQWVLMPSPLTDTPLYRGRDGGRAPAQGSCFLLEPAVWNHNMGDHPQGT